MHDMLAAFFASWNITFDYKTAKVRRILPFCEVYFRYCLGAVRRVKGETSLESARVSAFIW